MPPKTTGKKGATGKKGGKKKEPMTKEEKQKKQKEEAERKAKEEELARIKAEQEEAERLEKERLEAEEKRRLETEELKKRKGQLSELDAILANNYNTLFSEKYELRKNAKWARYMKCDGSPDPSVLGEINMYLTLWKEDKKKIDFNKVLNESILLLQLMDELEFQLNDDMDSEMTDVKRDQYKNTMFELQELLQEKLNLGTHDLMLKSSSMAAPDHNLIKIIGNDIITLCLWSNLTKNPRSKSFDFDVKGMVFELNPILNRADCGIRALFTKFDHLSQHSQLFYPRIKLQEPPESVTLKTDVHEMETERKEEMSTKEDEKIHNTEPIKNNIDSDGEDEKEQAAEQKVAVGEEEEEEEEEDEQETFDENDISTPVPLDYDDFDGDEEVVDLRAYNVVGGIFHIDLCQLPPQPKTARKWTITLLVDPPQLHYIDYIAEKEPKEEEAPVEAEGGEKKEKELEKTPIMVTLRLPNDVSFCEEPQVARWSRDENVWKTNGIFDKVYNEAGRQLTFRMCRFGSLALLQDAHVNMPFQSWELRPHNLNHSQLTIIAAIVEVEFQIKDGLVCLSQPENKPELSHLLNKWMPVCDLVKKMCETGINVFPAEDSFKYVKIPDKNAVAEDRLYRQMSLVSSAMAFSWSRWNLDVNDKEKIVIQGAEHLTDEALLEDDWSLFLITKRRSTKLKMTEYSEVYSDDIADGTQYNADLYHMTMDITSEPAKERIDETNANFSDSVYNLLRLTRVIPYS